MFLVCDGGHFLFWIPMSTKSVKIGYMDVMMELADRGHQVTIVSPYPSKKEFEGVTDVIIHSDFPSYQEELTKNLLNNHGIQPLPLSTLTQMALDSNKAAMQNEMIESMLTSSSVDVIITLAMFGNEAAFYLAEKYNASLVTFATKMDSNPSISWAV